MPGLIEAVFTGIWACFFLAVGAQMAALLGSGGLTALGAASSSASSTSTSGLSVTTSPDGTVSATLDPAVLLGAFGSLATAAPARRLAQLSVTASLGGALAAGLGAWATMILASSAVMTAGGFLG